MLRSLYSGVTGMKAHQVRMDVIGNNISNVNTTGFKGGRVNFSDMLNQTIRGAIAPGEGGAGINPAQVGLGVKIGGIDTIFTQGGLQVTDRTTDLAIQGNGFFVVNSPINGQPNFSYTRDGALSLDKEGYLVHTATGMRLQGWSVDPISGIINDTDGDNLKDLRDVSDILVSNFTEASAPTVGGAPATNPTISVTHGTTKAHQWAATWNAGTNEFDITVDGAPVNVDVNGTSVSSVAPGQTFTYEGSVVTIPAAYGAGNDFSWSTTEYELLTFSFDKEGLITGLFKDPAGGEPVAKKMGKLAIASFFNLEGLYKKGNNLYELSLTSGAPKLNNGTDRMEATVESGYLEMSNVDLTAEFTNMIITQRGFQANSRIITTSDSMLEELLSLKR